MDFSIHSNNSILISHHIQSNQIKSSDETYESALKKSIKCHHSELSCYIENNLLIKKDDDTSFDERILEIAFKSYNYSYFPNNFDQNNAFFYSCKYNY